MSQKAKPPARGGAGGLLSSCEARAASQGQHTPPERPRQLSIAPHSATVAIVVTESKDGARIDVETWTRHDNGWRLGGFTPSFAAILLDDVIRALIIARDVRAGRR